MRGLGDARKHSYSQALLPLALDLRYRDGLLLPATPLPLPLATHQSPPQNRLASAVDAARPYRHHAACLPRGWQRRHAHRWLRANAPDGGQPRRDHAEPRAVDRWLVLSQRSVVAHEHGQNVLAADKGGVKASQR